MYFPREQPVGSSPDSLAASAGKKSRPFFRWQFQAFVVLAALLMAGCNHRIASEENVDVCALALDAVTAALKQTPITEPRPDVCVFQTAETSPVQGHIQINLFTDASQGYSGGVESMLRVALVEAENAYGPGVSGFESLAEVAIAFGGNSPNNIFISERGVLMELSISGSLRLSHDEVVTLTRELWARVTNYKRPAA